MPSQLRVPNARVRVKVRVPNARVRVESESFSARVQVKSRVSKFSSRVGLESESRTRVLQHWLPITTRYKSAIPPGLVARAMVDAFYFML